MQDVADQVGLSRQLVSIVLRGVAGASDESRERVLTAAREMGYYPDDSARLLRRQRSRQLGVLFTMRQPFEVDLVDALYAESERLGYTLALSHMGPGRSQRTAIDELMRQRIEALIVLAAEHGAETITALPPSVPALLLGGPRAEGEHDDVRVDNAAGVRLAVEHLRRLGHERIAFVGGAPEPNAAERLAGFAAALGSEADVVTSDYSESGGHAAALAILARDDRPTALVCGNDRCAFGVIETLVRAGVRVPHDISIVGFDDSSLARLPFVDLTSVRPGAEHMAALALEAIDARITGPDAPVARHRVAPTLVVRGSTARVGG
ncbi:LacI family DNA-binding transcriptional regulator [Micrococcales bacterium 31B]|nr:LacI family DNA-binding transcriptional regulator [Micrococcales bacterium 31B]